MDLDQEKLQNLVELATLLNSQNDFEEILRCVAQQAKQHLNADVCSILMVNPRTRQTVKTLMREGVNVKNRPLRDIQNLISGWIMKTKRPLISPDITEDARFDQLSFENISIKAVMGTPLRAEGTLIGTIIVVNQEQSHAFTWQDLAYLNKLAIISAPYLRNAHQIQKFFERPIPNAALREKYAKIGLLGRSKKFIDLLKSIESATRCDVRVLLEGPSGTGKELVARAIHTFSARSEKPFVAIDCGAIPEHLLESELFGHAKGAFTGATRDRKGLLEEANGGTLFMDEIANLPLAMQAKFMRVLQEGEIRPLGSNKSKVVDVRIIAASSASLRDLIDSSGFREDLFFRLHVYPITVPPLSERREDIPMLASHFLQHFAKQQGKPLQAFDEEVLGFLCQQTWPGNIRELENLVERLVTVAPADTETVEGKMLPSELRKSYGQFHEIREGAHAQNSLKDQLRSVEAKILEKTLRECNWNQSQAARKLRISERNIRYRIEKLKIVRPVK